MAPRDVGLFLKSARTDQRIAVRREAEGARAAFESVYAELDDPWASADPRYFYQRWKYQSLMAALPHGRRFGRALDLGSGTGALSVALTGVADEVLGLDIAQSAVDLAERRAGARPGLRFAQGDVGALDPALDGNFDLVVIADTLYYLDRVDDHSLKTVASRVARLLAPGGLCLLVNHYFTSLDKDSRLTRRIHDAFAWSPGLDLVFMQRRPFYLTSLLSLAVPSLALA
jgi:predicted TPR repeat methyltransferase